MTQASRGGNEFGTSLQEHVMRKSGFTVSSLSRRTSAGYRDAGEVDLRFERHVSQSKRKSLFVSMNTQAIKASIIQAACREQPSLRPETPNVAQTAAEQYECSSAITNKRTCCKSPDKTDRRGIIPSIWPHRQFPLRGSHHCVPKWSALKNVL